LASENAEASTSDRRFPGAMLQNVTNCYILRLSTIRPGIGMNELRGFRKSAAGALTGGTDSK
jgi:hypothetical protein